MSKLLKFKHWLTMTEATELFSKLINEEVSAKDIAFLNKGGWIHTLLQCKATIVKLKPVIDPASQAWNAKSDRKLMEIDEDCGLCFDLLLPMQHVEIVGAGIAYALFDEDGGRYALRDEATQTYLYSEHDALSFFDERIVESHGVYKLAAHANTDSPSAPPTPYPREVWGCTYTKPLYTFISGENEQNTITAPTNKSTQEDAPSLVLAVATLIEIATSDKIKKYNQSSLIDEVLDRYNLRGLSKSNLEKIFSRANKVLADAQKSSKT